MSIKFKVKCLTDVLMPQKDLRHMGCTDAPSPQDMGNIWYRGTYRSTGGMEGHMDVWGCKDIHGEYGCPGGIQMTPMVTTPHAYL